MGEKNVENVKDFLSDERYSNALCFHRISTELLHFREKFHQIVSLSKMITIPDLPLSVCKSEKRNIFFQILFFQKYQW